MTSYSTNREACNAYIKFFESITPESISELDALSTDDLYFEDPFNQLTGRSNVKRLFEQMFEHVDVPAFKVNSTFWETDGNTAVLKWRFTGQLQKIGTVDFEGMSEIKFNSAHLIFAHVDYWDAASHFYEKIPVLGGLLRLIKKSIRLS
jgi:ketosteroid isomerase-like protein